MLRLTRNAAATLICLPMVLSAQAAMARTLRCEAQSSRFNVEFAVPARIGAKPLLDYEHPVEVTEFSFRQGNLVLVAMDHAERSRVRIVISAQASRGRGLYSGQVYADEGGMQVQIDNGPVTCKLIR